MYHRPTPALLKVAGGDNRFPAGKPGTRRDSKVRIVTQTTLKDLIIDAYGQAVLAASQKGLTGANAKAAACKAAAHVVSKATGKAVTPELVAKAIASS